MFARLFRFLLLSVGLMAAPACLLAQSQPQPTTSLGVGAVPLDGSWQFHLGDDPAWASSGINDATGQDGWQTVDLGWFSGQQPSSYVGYAWYRRHIRLAAGPEPEISLMVDNANCTYEVYWNGVRVGQEGKFPPRPRFNGIFSPPRVFRLGPVSEGVLAIRMWKHPRLSFDTGKVTGFNSAPVIGSDTAISGVLAKSGFLSLSHGLYFLALDMLYLQVAIFGFLGWWRDRRQFLLLWAALFCLFPLWFDGFSSLGVPYGSTASFGPAYSVLGAGDIALWLLLIWLFQLDDNRRLLRITALAGFITFTADTVSGWILSLADWSAPSFSIWRLIADSGANLSIAIGILFPLYLVRLGLRTRLDSARWILVSFALLNSIVTTVGNVATQAYRPLHWRFADETFQPLIFIGQSGLNIRDIAQSLLLLSILYAVYRSLRENARRRNLLEQELKSAREIQRVLIPEALPSVSGYALTSSYLPALEVGGDFFQILPLEGEPADSELVLIGDVSGKGLKAAMAVAMIVGMTRALTKYTASPGELLALLNERLQGRLQGGFATCIALRLDPDGLCTLASAGHPAPFLNGAEIEMPSALPLGLFAETDYEEAQCTLSVGDYLALYTDGLLEARSRSGELYGFERLHTLFIGKPSAAQATEAAVVFGQDDDITVLTLTRLAAGVASSSHISAPARATA